MKQLKKYMIAAAFALLLAGQILPGQAAAADAAIPQETAPAFQNPDGMTLDLIYYYADKADSEVVAGKAERTIIPVGVTAVTVEMQEEHLPEGFQLKDPKELPLEEDTLEVKILVEPIPNANPDNQPEQDPDEKPQEDTEAKPEGTPDAQPDGKPESKPENKPENKPGNKPENKPQNKPGKPDPSNPKTGDPFSLSLWLTLATGAGAALFLVKKKLL